MEIKVAKRKGVLFRGAGINSVEQVLYEKLPEKQKMDKNIVSYLPMTSTIVSVQLGIDKNHVRTKGFVKVANGTTAI